MIPSLSPAPTRSHLCLTLCLPHFLPPSLPSPLSPFLSPVVGWGEVVWWVVWGGME